MKLGFIGIGTIASAVIEALLSRGPHQIVVSPRSAVRSRALAERWPEFVHVAASNIEVAQTSDIVFLAVRPAQLEQALEGVCFDSGHAVVSFVTGLSLAELQLMAPAATVARVLPLPFIRRGVGPVILCPALPVTRELFGTLGDVIEPRDENELMALGGVSGFMSTYFELAQHLQEWLAGRGVPVEVASLYVRSMFFAMGVTGLSSTEAQHLDLVTEHETPGGLNQRVRSSLAVQGWFDAPGHAMDSIANLARKQLE
jgi:pyrroline-5-carboxylate reductase